MYTNQTRFSKAITTNPTLRPRRKLATLNRALGRETPPGNRYTDSETRRRATGVPILRALLKTPTRG